MMTMTMAERCTAFAVVLSSSWLSSFLQFSIQAFKDVAVSSKEDENIAFMQRIASLPFFGLGLAGNKKQATEQNQYWNDTKHNEEINTSKY